MNKKIASEIAVGIILLLAIIVGGIFWLQNKSQVPVTTPIVNPAAEPVAQVQQKTQENEMQQNFLPESFADMTFDMINVDKNYNPCEEKYEKADPGISEKIKAFYVLLKNRDYKSAISAMQISKNENLFPYLFPFCSAMHEPLAYTVGQDGIIMFVKSGNGLPSVPNDGNYSFEYLWIFGDKILLKRDNVDHYFDGKLGAEYKKIMDSYNSDPNADFDRAMKILDQVEAETIKGVEIGSFTNLAVQKEYDEFVSSLKLANSAADWQTYTNEKYGYQFKYPMNWNYTLENGGICLRENGKKYNSEESDICGISISESTNSNTQRINASDWAKLKEKNGAIVSNIKIDGFDAVQSVDYLGTETIIIKPLGNGLEVDIAMPNIGDDKLKESLEIVYNKIISTFKFTK